MLKDYFEVVKKAAETLKIEPDYNEWAQLIIAVNASLLFLSKKYGV